MTKIPFIKKTLGFACLILLLSCQRSNSEQDQPSNTGLDEFTVPTNNPSNLPYLITGEDGKLYLSWVEQDSSISTLLFSTLIDDQWSSPETIATGNDWFVNWADYPMIAIDSAGNMIAHYLAKSSAGTYSYNVNVVTKPRDSTNWSAPIIPHNDGTPTEHGFVSLLPNNDGSFTLAWLDGRNTGGDHGGHSGSMTLRSAIIDLAGNLTNEFELDNRVCDCCQTTASMTKKGPMVAYRDRSIDEVRDMAFVLFDENEWSESSMVATDLWEIEGCPVNGPRMDSFGESTAIAWFTGALNRPLIKVAFMDEDQFREPIILDANNPIGRVDLEMIDDETAIVSWVTGGQDSNLVFRKVKKSGELSPPIVVTSSASDRASGFPQIEVAQDVLYFASTDISGQDKKIRTHRIRLNELF